MDLFETIALGFSRALKNSLQLQGHRVAKRYCCACVQASFALEIPMTRFRLPWIRERKRTAPEIVVKPPLQIGALSNGEVFRAQTPRSRLAERMIFEFAERGARRLNVDRREFLASSMGMASSLW